jgi:hypothetical protein
VFAFDFLGGFDLSLDKDQVNRLLAIPQLEKQEELIKEAIRLDELYKYQVKALKELKLKKMRAILEAYESGVSQPVLADIFDVTAQHISKTIRDCRLIMHIPDGLSLREFDENEAARIRAKFTPSSELKPASESADG